MPLKRILIVEDSVDIGRMYQDMIQTAFPGAPIIFVPSAEEGILEASRYTIDLLITDIRLPGMSGFDLARKVKTRQPEVQVMIVTGLRIDQDLERMSREVGAAVLLAKPLVGADFLGAIEKITGETARMGALEMEVQPARRGARSVGLRRAVNEPKTEPPAKTAPLTLPPTAGGQPLSAGAAFESGPVPPLGEPSTPLSLSVLLSELRGSLGAPAVVLLDDQGRTMAQAGDWPAPELEARLVAPLMAGLSALEKLSQSLQPGLPAAAHLLRGPEYDLCFAPVGRFALLIFLPNRPGALRPALAVEELLAAAPRLAQVLEGMGLIIRRGSTASLPAPAESTGAPALEALLPAASAEPPAAPEDPTRLQALEALLEMPPAAPDKTQADDFWDQLASAASASSAAPSGALSYEQARKLGLVDNDQDISSAPRS